MKRYLFILIGSFQFFCSTAYTQYVVKKENFLPFERTGDTIYFNKNNYKFVLTNTKELIYARYVVRLYHLYSLNDLKNTSGMNPYDVQLKNHENNLSGEYYSKLCAIQKQFDKKPLETKDVKIKKNNISYYMEESNLLFPEVTKDTTLPIIDLPLEILPELNPILNKFYKYLNFENFQQYDVAFKVGDSVLVSVTVPVLCNPEIHGTGKRYDQLELEKILESLISGINWPKLKVEDKVLDYSTIRTDIGRMNYVELLIKEQQNKQGQLVKLYSHSDSLLIIVDSLNYLTTVYIPGHEKDENPTGFSKTITGYIDTNKELFDINNDGRKDYVLDTFDMYSHAGTTTGIEYIPNYSRTSQYSYYLTETISYTKSLGNHYYYVSGENTEANIFYIKNNEYIDLLSIINNYYGKKWKIHYKQFTHTIVYKNNELSQTYPTGSKKAIMLKKKIKEKIKFYIEHPEKLPIDFPMN